MQGVIAVYIAGSGAGINRKAEFIMNYTYLVQCADGSLYCGWTNHLEERVKAHNQGKGAKYTKSRRPVTLVYYEEFATKNEAMKREASLKKLSRQDKLNLCGQWKETHINDRTAFTSERLSQTEDSMGAGKESGKQASR